MEGSFPVPLHTLAIATVIYSPKMKSEATSFAEGASVTGTESWFRRTVDKGKCRVGDVEDIEMQ